MTLGCKALSQSHYLRITTGKPRPLLAVPLVPANGDPLIGFGSAYEMMYNRYAVTSYIKQPSNGNPNRSW
jgi:hypothetical protein